MPSRNRAAWVTNGLFRQSNICSQAGFSKNQCSLLGSSLKCTLMLGTTIAWTMSMWKHRTKDCPGGVPVLSREKLTPSMMKHLELRSSENCLACGRAVKTRMIAQELLLMPKTVLMIYHAWFFTFIGSALSSLVTLSSSWKAVYFHLLHIHWCLYYVDNSYVWAYTANTIDWMGPHF